MNNQKYSSKFFLTFLFLITSFKLMANIDEINKEKHRVLINDYLIYLNSGQKEISNKEKLINLYTSLIISQNMRESMSNVISINFLERYKYPINSEIYKQHQELIIKNTKLFFQDEYYLNILQILHDKFSVNNTNYNQFIDNIFLRGSRIWNKHFIIDSKHDKKLNNRLHFIPDEVGNLDSIFNYSGLFSQASVIQFYLSHQYSNIRNFISYNLHHSLKISEDEAKEAIFLIQYYMYGRNFTNYYSMVNMQMLNTMIVTSYLNFTSVTNFF